MPALQITTRQLAALVKPVLPSVSNDFSLPVLNAVRIESHGKWLVATARDRFRLGMHRLAAPPSSEGGTWPEWSATIPVVAIKSILSTYKATRGSDADLTLAIDGDRLTVNAAGLMLGGFLGASATYSLELGDFPKVHGLIRAAIAGEAADGGSALLNWYYVASFKDADAGAGLYVKPNAGGSTKPTLITDGEDFIGILMPRRSQHDGVSGFPNLADWTEILADKSEPKPKTKKAASKPRAKTAEAVPA